MAEPRGPGAAWVVVPALACAVVVALAVLVGPVPLSGDSPLDRLRPAPVAGEAPDEEPAADAVGADALEAPPTDGIPVEVVVGLLVTIVCLALLARAVLRAARRPADDDEEAPDAADETVDALDDAAVAEAARQGLLRLHDVPPDRAADVVVACWVELELAAGAAGAARRWTDTPTDFADRLAAAAPGLDRPALDGLRRTYSRVRFGGPGSPERHVTREEVDEARVALSGLLGALGTGRRT
ncbi:DUF4129 domain-containing protein [Aquipuribacter nitratireducens]|uniref:DUF4129 domain-containing protein n=1 Tax=Aquipuribacter nitratireducens TaxID=650104 RepID=A0ABW0GJK1_9MICO